MNKKKKLSLSVVAIMLTILICLGITYALWMRTYEQSEDNLVGTGCFDVSFSDGDSINLVDAYPITDAEGLDLEPYSFKLENICSITASYMVKVEITSDSTLPENHIKIAIDNQTSMISDLDTGISTLTKAGVTIKATYILYTGVLYAGEEVTHDVREWLDENAPELETSNKFLKSYITIEATTSDLVKPPVTVVKVEAGYNWSLALLSNGTVVGWGYNFNGVLGYDGNVATPDPILVQTITGAVDISAGAGHNLILKEDGTVWSMGWNNDGQLGDGTKTNSTVPVQATGISGAKIIRATVRSHTILEDGSLWFWGKGCLGDGQIANTVIVPTQILSLNNVIHIANGTSTTQALLEGGTVWAWGQSSSQMIGDGSNNVDRLSPVQLTALSNIKKVEVGATNGVALTNAGAIWTWGGNSDGGLGMGSAFLNRSTPMLMTTLSGVADIVVNEASHFALALKNDKTLWGWGSNTRGQMGHNNNTTQYTPIQIGGLNNIVQFDAGMAHGIALKEDGTVWTWGGNDYGQLGDGTTNNNATPTQVDLSAFID